MDFSAREKFTEGTAAFKDKDNYCNQKIGGQRGTSIVNGHVMQNKEEETKRGRHLQ